MQDASLLRASRFEYWTRTGRNEEEGTEWKVKVRLSAIFRTSLHTSLCAFERALKEMSCSLRWHLSFFFRISVTRLFVKYDSSFSLWRRWRWNKYRQTRIFIKLQRDTNTCKMFACRIKIPQKRQTKSEDASLEPTIVLCSTDQMDHPEFRRPRLPTLKRSRILAWNGNYKSLDLTDSREKWDTPFIGKSVKSRA